MLPVGAGAAVPGRTPSTARTCRDDPRVGIDLEDHYFDNTDAAVVFKRLDRDRRERYIYHGNDGTIPWNDTAQLDYLHPDVREAVIRTILDVARRFPIIRFDAAMVLAGSTSGGSGSRSRARRRRSRRAPSTRCPRRSSTRAMPLEFWREVVDRVAAEVPGTLLLAEAFWLLEGYFVRTLGMHRVYNSAFMHMLRDENNAGYRKVIRETIEFDPEILGRYVNFMNNPDERTAVDQFGTGDKYFGVATVLATLPGLPMLGHGQVEGFGEKYGMEFRRAMLDEQPDPWLVGARAQIVPLLHGGPVRRGEPTSSCTTSSTERGHVDEDVLAYSNGAAREAVARRLSGPVRVAPAPSAFLALAVKSATGAKLKGPPIAGGRASGCPTIRPRSSCCRDARTGLEYLRSVSRALGPWPRDLARRLHGHHVFWEFREVWDGVAGQWARLSRAPGGPRRPVARRGDARAPARADPRADAGGVRRRHRAGGAGRTRPDPRTSTASRRGSRRSSPAIATATGVPGDPAVAGARRSASGRNGASASPRRPCRPIGRPSSAGSRCHGPESWHRAPMSRRPAGPGSTSCG